MKMKTLYLVRHGETDWNRAGRYQGHEDRPLTEKGRQQANRLARGLAGKQIDVIHTSDLQRAYNTAAPIAEASGAKLHTHRGLREMHFGRWGGLTFADIARQFPEVLQAYREDSFLTLIPGGESYLNVFERVQRSWSDSIAASPPARVMVVAHGGSIKALICYLLGVHPRQRGRFLLDNAGVTIFRWRRKGPSLLRYNDLSFLNSHR